MAENFAEGSSEDDHTTLAYPMAEYPGLLEAAPKHYMTFYNPEVPSLPVSTQLWNVLCPDASTSRVFINRSFEQYAKECAASGKPTRLIVGCGHSAFVATPGHDSLDGGCPGHNEDYFTINVYDGRNPDILGDVLRMKEQAFRPKSWDFITYECFPWNGYFNDEHLSMIANSLRPNGAWVFLCDLDFFPSVIKIGDQDFKGGESLAEAPSTKGWIARNICAGSGKMLDADTVSFTDHADVRATVDCYFTARGFKRAEIRTLPFAEFLPVELPRISFLTGETVAIDNGVPSFGEDVDLLGGDEFFVLSIIISLSLPSS